MVMASKTPLMPSHSIELRPLTQTAMVLVITQIPTTTMTVSKIW